MQLTRTRKVLNYDMKMKLLMTMAILTAAAQLGPVACGEDQKGQGAGWRGHRNDRFASLPADERQKLKAAHEKAMQDPAVRAAHDKMRQAHREFRNAMHAAMLQADPSIQPILDKMPKGGKGDRDED
jgi:hypothetical protein